MRIPGAWIAAAWIGFRAFHPAAAANYADDVLDATFKFSHPDSTATCFLVRRPAPDTRLYLVTAAHVLEAAQGAHAIVVLRDRQSDGSYLRREQEITLRDDDQPRWTRHAKEDVAVLAVDGRLLPPGAGLPEAALADEAGLRSAGAHVGGPLLVLTYPERFEANGAGFPVARQGIFASPPLLPSAKHPTFLADFTTFAGDSGGPVFVEGAHGKPLIVGLVVAQSHQEDRIKTEYEERLTRRPLGLGTVVHAAFIRETLAAASRARSAPARPGR